eukprot:1161616-Pelagomonas_calceolata.AAC.5
MARQGGMLGYRGRLERMGGCCVELAAAKHGWARVDGMWLLIPVVAAVRSWHAAATRCTKLHAARPADWCLDGGGACLALRSLMFMLSAGDVSSGKAGGEGRLSQPCFTRVQGWRLRNAEAAKLGSKQFRLKPFSQLTPGAFLGGGVCSLLRVNTTLPKLQNVMDWVRRRALQGRGRWAELVM